jgi:endonuclease-3
MVRKTAAPKRAGKKAAKKASKKPSKQASKQPPKKTIDATARKQRPQADGGASPPWTNAEIEEAFRRFQAANPEPATELQHVTPFTLLVAVVLSAQATDAGVNKATPALFAAADAT